MCMCVFRKITKTTCDQAAIEISSKTLLNSHISNMKTEAEEVKVKLEDNYDEKLLNINKIANPIASRKLAKKIYKLIKKASKERAKNIVNGLKDVQTRIRKGERGLTIFAGDVFPVEIVCHLPAVCEEKDISYCYTPSRQDLGTAMGVKRGSIVLMIRENPDYKELFDEVKGEIKCLPTPF